MDNAYTESEFRKSRKWLLSLSLVLLFILSSNLEFREINIFGNVAEIESQKGLYSFYMMVMLYFAIRYYIFFKDDYYVDYIGSMNNIRGRSLSAFLLLEARKSIKSSHNKAFRFNASTVEKDKNHKGVGNYIVLVNNALTDESYWHEFRVNVIRFYFRKYTNLFIGLFVQDKVLTEYLLPPFLCVLAIMLYFIRSL